MLENRRRIGEVFGETREDTVRPEGESEYVTLLLSLCIRPWIVVRY